jgi:hypothetical protein
MPVLSLGAEAGARELMQGVLMLAQSAAKTKNGFSGTVR